MPIARDYVRVEGGFVGGYEVCHPLAACIVESVFQACRHRAHWEQEGRADVVGIAVCASQ